jgi:drug/metabolite transporter (DMT)-like permease
MVRMTADSPSSDRLPLWKRIADQPYLLLSLTSLFWAGNAIVGRFASGQIPPVTLSFLRWALASLIVLPFAWRHLIADWSAIRERIGVMVLASMIGLGFFNMLQYTALQYTTALNVLLLQSAGPLFVAVWSLLLLGVRLTWAQAGGIAVSLIGVLVILLEGDLAALASFRMNKGDLIFLFALALFGLYTVLIRKRPAIHDLSFLGFTFACGTLITIPFLVWELMTRPLPSPTSVNLLAVIYVAVFPSLLAYICYNRGVQIIGPNRSAPFFHLIPVFGAALAILFLGERMQLFHVVGFVLVLAGVYFAARKASATKASAT